jgi:hypothetical protein
MHKELGSEMVELEGKKIWYVDYPYSIRITLETALHSIPISLIHCSLSQLYFKQDQMRNCSIQNQPLAGFEKIRTVGKGGFGQYALKNVAE